MQKNSPAEVTASDSGPGDGRTRILTAALEAFSTVGFGGSSLRQIAEKAGVQHQLVVYHFKTKDNLWKAVIHQLIPFQDGAVTEQLQGQKTKDPAVALAEHIRRFVVFTVKNPELHRILTIEAHAKTERQSWLTENYVAPYYQLSTGIIRRAQRAGVARQGDPGMLHYALIGLLTTFFIGAIEYEAMTGNDPFDSAEIARVIDLAYDFMELDVVVGSRRE